MNRLTLNSKFETLKSLSLVIAFGIATVFGNTAKADIFDDLIDIVIDDLDAGVPGVGSAFDVAPTPFDLELEHSGAAGFDVDINPAEGCDFIVTLKHFAPIDGATIPSYDWKISDIHMRDENGDVMFAKITGIEILPSNEMPTESIFFTDWVCSVVTGHFPSNSSGAINDYIVRVAVIGDVNNDCAINLLDVDPFVDLLNEGGYSVESDINQDGLLNLLDVGEFVGLLAE